MTQKAKTKGSPKRTRIKDLPKKEEGLTAAEAKKVKGGLLPYVEQDNLYKSTNVTDGTSNTILINKNR